MTLDAILEIQHRYIDYQDERGLLEAEQLYQRSGAPSEPRALSAVLEKILLRLQSEGIPYPKILLLRRKQLQRHDWKPRKRETPESVEEPSHLQDEPGSRPAFTRPRRPPTPEPTPRSEEEVIAEARATYTPEQFDRWLKMHEHGKMLRDADGKGV